MEKHFIDPKRCEILSVFLIFPCTMQIALFWPKLLPALFLKTPWYPRPFEILAEALGMLQKNIILQCAECQWRVQFASSWTYKEVTTSS
jgi:hypothetical protein